LGDLDKNQEADSAVAMRVATGRTTFFVHADFAQLD
jgi:hypothetical protein